MTEITYEAKEGGLPAIVRVGALDGDCFDMTLSNGHSILLELGDRITEPGFAKLIKAELFDRPQTDGQRLYWVDGPSFTVAEIFELLASDKRR